MKLNLIKDNIYYIDAPVNMGLIVNEQKEALLVDAGIDDSVARKLRRLVDENGFTLKGIIITHAHADHCGGAPYLVKSTGAKVYANSLEKSVLENPILEPVYLFGGACPPHPLHNKFFLAPGVQVDGVLENGLHNVAGCELEIVDLAGHALGQIGVAAGGVLFCADAVIAPEILNKHGIPLNASIDRAVETFTLLEQRRDNYYLPAHGTLLEDIQMVLAANRRRVEETIDYILSLLTCQRTAEELLATTCARFNVRINNLGQYYLMHLTVMAYLGHLLDKKQITTSYQDNRQYFSLTTAG